MSGWFAVKRGITEHPLFQGNADRLAVWVWLLDHAAWKETRHNIAGKVVTIKAGQICASERRISDSIGVGRQVVRTMLDHLEANQMITRDLTHGRTIVTLCNWDKYQNVGPAANPDVTQKQPKANPQKEQGNKVNKKTKEQEPFGFGAFWAAYPRHVARDAAVTAYRAAMKKASEADILSGATRYAEQVRQRDTEERYIAHPATWLNQGRWADEAPTAQPGNIVNMGWFGTGTVVR
jgi:hypothetical protein